MFSSSRVRLTTAFSLLLLISVVGFALFGSTRLVSHAVGTSLKPFTTSSVKASCGAWSVIPSPNVATYSNILYGITALSAYNAWAVGYYQDSNGTIGLTLTEHWNGTKWSIVPSANPAGAVYNILTEVVALSAHNIWAVGYSYYVPSSGSGYDLTLIEHWNGTKWQTVPSPNPGLLTNIFTGVTATSGSDVWAGGYYQNSISSGDSNPHTLIEHWNGTKWSVVPSPNPGTSVSVLTSIAASSLSNAWAVGYYQDSNGPISLTLTEHWNGTQWSIVPSPNIGSSQNALNGVTTYASKVRAVGYYQDVNGNGGWPLIEHWDGTKWLATSGPAATGSSYNILNGITALSANNAWAVGYYINASTNIDQTLTEQWNGTGWNVVSSPNIGMSANRLSAIAQVSGTTQVWVAGYYGGNSGYQTLIEFYC